MNWIAIAGARAGNGYVCTLARGTTEGPRAQVAIVQTPDAGVIHVWGARYLETGSRLTGKSLASAIGVACEALGIEYDRVTE